MFYDTSEYDTNPAAAGEIDSLLGNYNEIQMPSRAPGNNQEHLQGGMRVLSTGAVGPGDFNSLFSTLTTGLAPDSYAPGSMIERPETGQREYVPTTYAQDRAAGKPMEGAFTAKDRWGMTKDLYTQTRKDNEAFNTSRFQWQAMRDAPEGGAGDLVLITGLNKMLDPGSTVRGEEAEAASKVGGTLGSIMNIVNEFKEGDKLEPGARAKIRETAETLYKIREQQYRRNYQVTGEMVDKYGLSRPEVFRGAPNPDEFGSEEPRAPATAGQPSPAEAVAELQRRRRQKQLEEQQRLQRGGAVYGP